MFILSLKLHIKDKFMDKKINNIQLTQNLACLLTTYKNMQLKSGISKILIQ